MKTTNQTNPNHAVKEENDPITTKQNGGFGFDWFGLRFFYLIGSILNTPTYKLQNNESSLQFKF